MDLQSKEMMALVPVSKSVFMDIERFENAQRVAKMFAEATMVPEDYRKNIGNCMIALNYAWRLGVDELQLMQSLYIIYGKPGIEGKLVIALINACGRYEPLEFIEDKDLVNGQKTDDKGCIARAKEIKSGKVLDGPKVDWKMVKAEGWDKDKQNKTTSRVQKSKWNTMPQLMFHYRAAAFFGRTKCPEVILGLQTKEELEDVTDLARGSDGTYTTDEDLKGKTQAKIDALEEKGNKSIDDKVALAVKAREADQERILAGKMAGEPVDPGKPEDFEAATEKPITGEQLDDAVGMTKLSGHAADTEAPLSTDWDGVLPEDMPAGPPLWKEANYKGRRTGNAKTSGLAGWVNRNRHILFKAPDEDLAKILTKWPTHYKIPFPTLEPLNPGQDQAESTKTAHSSQGPAPEGNENQQEKPPSTVNQTGFPLTDAALEALGPEGPEIYEQAKKDLAFPDGPYTSGMDKAVANRMSTLVDRAVR
ncbi:MAG TPA: hypothetical protein ENI07_14295 [Desulfobacterales bacterium]|nr:hypothetical protein [Desulfobacterales bacterium]